MTDISIYDELDFMDIEHPPIPDGYYTATLE